MNQIELFAIIERWKIIRDDFDALDRDDPNTVIGPDGAFEDKSRAGRDWSKLETEEQEALKWSGNRVVWVLGRVDDLFETTTKYGLFDEDEACLQWTIGGALTPVARFLLEQQDGNEGDGREPTQDFIRFIRWFMTGYEDESESVIRRPFRVARDACSYIVDELLMKLGGLKQSSGSPPPSVVGTWDLLSPSNLATIFDLSPDTIAGQLKKQVIPNYQSSTKRYWVDPHCLPQDWKARLSQSTGMTRSPIKSDEVGS